ncbi:chromosome partitioning protein [Amphritea atlantica]|uniref:Chromosome partitioning protein n=1 Tax=Amphritea atlantica TaxID=355243 RepID=A0A1H9I4T0_9GAMM|nr:AAA family ATPase [Amphritea atlantica]SEQ69590.1 chromosome partitioning protein [Amphritea atlantica]
MTIIVCPNCSRKHHADTSKVAAKKRFVVRCKACDHKFLINLDHSEVIQPVTSAPPAPAPAPTEQPAATSASSATTPEPQQHQNKPRKICVSLSKGGVGKTTTAVNLSAGLAMAGYKVLLIDTDTQGQSSFMLGKKPPAGLTELLTGELTPKETIVEARPNLFLLSGGRSLAGVKRIIDKKSFGSEWTLAEAMEDLDKEYDYVIIDTSPGWDQLTVNVLFYATEVLTPVSLEVMSLHGLAEFTKNLHAIKKYKEIDLNYILPTFLDTRVEQPQNIYRKLQSLYGDKVCTPIRYDEQLSRSPSHGETIFEFLPDGDGAADYSALVRTITGNKTILLGDKKNHDETVIPSL